MNIPGSFRNVAIVGLGLLMTFCSSSLLAQPLPQLEFLKMTGKEGIVWSKQEFVEGMTDPDSYRELAPSFDDCSLNPGKKYYRNFHLTDLNGDGRDDIIYEGSCPAENTVKIWIADGKGEYEIVFDWTGEVVALEVGYGTGMIGIHKKATKCAPYYQLILVYFEKQHLNPEVFEVKVHNETVEEFLTVNFRDVSEVLQNKWRLRTLPELDDKQPRTTCTNKTIKGNVLGDFVAERSFELKSGKGDWKLMMIKDLKKGNFHVGWAIAD